MRGEAWGGGGCQPKYPQPCPHSPAYPHAGPCLHLPGHPNLHAKPDAAPPASKWQRGAPICSTQCVRSSLWLPLLLQVWEEGQAFQELRARQVALTQHKEQAEAARKVGCRLWSFGVDQLGRCHAAGGWGGAGGGLCAACYTSMGCPLTSWQPPLPAPGALLSGAQAAPAAAALWQAAGRGCLLQWP